MRGKDLAQHAVQPHEAAARIAGGEGEMDGQGFEGRCHAPLYGVGKGARQTRQ